MMAQLIITRIYFNLGKIDEMLGKDNWRYFYRSGLKIIHEKKKKNIVQMYRLASFYKKLKDVDKAVKWYCKVEIGTSSEDILAGVYFHFCKILLQQGKYKISREYFEKCIKIIPKHEKAIYYLNGILNLN